MHSPGEIMGTSLLSYPSLEFIFFSNSSTPRSSQSGKHSVTVKSLRSERSSGSWNNIMKWMTNFFFFKQRECFDSYARPRWENTGLSLVRLTKELNKNSLNLSLSGIRAWESTTIRTTQQCGNGLNVLIDKLIEYWPKLKYRMETKK